AEHRKELLCLGHGRRRGAQSEGRRGGKGQLTELHGLPPRKKTVVGFAGAVVPGQWGKGQMRSFCLPTLHSLARPCGSTIRNQTMSAPNSITWVCSTAAIDTSSPNSEPSQGSSRLSTIGSTMMNAA